MKRMIPTLFAVSMVLNTGCSAAQIASFAQLAESYLAQVQLTQTDENGNTTAISAADVQTVMLDGRSIPASYTPDGQLQLPAGDYSRDHNLQVRLRDGSNVTLPLNRRDGTTQGKAILFSGELHRQAGRVVAADVIPGGQISDVQRSSHLQQSYVRIPINRPGLAGRLRTVGIDQQRLSQDACVVTPQGDLLVNRTVLQQFSRPGSRLWAVIDLGNQQVGQRTVGSRWVQNSYRNVPQPRYSLLVLQVNSMAALPPAPRPTKNNVTAITGSNNVTMHLGDDISWVSDETNITNITNITNYVYNGTTTNNYYNGVPASASPSPSPSATPTPAASASPSPVATASPSPSPSASASPSPSASATPTPSASPSQDDNGHGNDPGNIDPSNPGASGT